MTLFAIYADADNHVVVKVDGDAKTLTFTVTSGGSVAGTITIANCWAVRGDVLRVAVSQDADSIDVSVLGFSGLQTGTLAAVLAVAPASWRNIEPAGTLGTIDLVGIAVEGRALDATARAALVRGMDLFQADRRRSSAMRLVMME